MLRRSFLACFILAFFVLGCKSKRPTTLHKDRARAKTERATVDRSERERVRIPDTKKKGRENAPANTPYNTRVENYINQFSSVAKEEMRQYGIPASIKLAQGILESGAGGGQLALKSNNHFGIKCHRGWEGGRVYHDDDERGECFRKYNDPKYSFRDHSLFLVNRGRYKDLFSLKKDDYVGWSLGLKRAGYATDPKYPQKLIGIIERYQLYKYDQDTVETSNDVVDSNDKSMQTYLVKAGDTLYSISKRFGVSVAAIIKRNNIEDNTISIGQVLYLDAGAN